MLRDFIVSLDIEPNLVEIVMGFSEACVMIEKELNTYDRTNSVKLGHNISGDIQKPIDIRANHCIVSCLQKREGIFYLTSEEEDKTRLMYNGPLNPFPENIYSVAFDPLDGSDNVDCNGGVGTIFGIYKEINEHCQNGENLICSGYAIYSNPVIFVITFGEEVYEFKLNKDQIFTKTHKNLCIPGNPKRIFSGNAGNITKWIEKDRNFFNWLVSEREKYTFRYTGCMVFDIHRILCQGGIFIYPSDSKNKDGKLRMFYECMPMAFIVEAAGGMAYDGKKRLLDNYVVTPHQKTPIYIGCKRDITIYKYFYQIDRKNFVIETYRGSGSEELSVDEGEIIKDYTVLNDDRWTRVTSIDGKTGLVPTKCLFLGK